MINKSRIAAIGALVLGGGLAAVVPSLPAVGQSSPPVGGIRLISPSTVADAGAVVHLKEQIVCPFSDDIGLFVTVTESQGHHIASGNGYQSVTCSGTFQKVSISVNPTLVPFGPGVASVQAGGYFYDPYYGEVTDTTNGSVKLVVK